MIKLLPLSACYHTPEFYEKCYRYMRESCKKYDIDLKIYGMGATYYPGWIVIKITGQLSYLKSLQGDYTHVLYADASDGFFTGTLDDIIREYEAYGSPELITSGAMITQTEIPGHEEYFPGNEPYRFMHNGDYIAEIPYLIDLFEKFLEMSAPYGDDSHIWYESWRQGWFRPMVDKDCRIFQVMQTCWPETWEPVTVKDGRLYNKITKTYPLVVHMAGGYTDPENGKCEFIEPWFNQLI